MSSLVNYTDSESDSSPDSDPDADKTETKTKNKKRTIEPSHDSDIEPPKKKRRKLPSLNKISGHLFNDHEQCHKNKDNTEKHQGKIRRFAHVDGNWSVHIHIAIHQSFKQLFDKISNIVIENSDKQQTIHCMNEFHISLSICQPIKTFQIKDFVASFTKLFKNVNPFNISLNGLIKFYSNDTNQRYFGALLIDDGNQDIIDLINIINSGMNKWGLRQYYESPEPHISFIWSLNEFNFKTAKLKQVNAEIQNELKTATTTTLIDTITIKVGHRKYDIKVLNK